MSNLLEAIGADETPTFIMPTYTAMFDLRGEISKHTDIKAIFTNKEERELWN